MSRRYPCIYCTEDLHCTKYSDDDCESWCVLGPCTAETPSNGDKIRRMTDEELAEFLWSIGASPFNGAVYINGKPIFSTADGNKWLGWLKQEAGE